jgi:hypothetical protein
MSVMTALRLKPDEPPPEPKVTGRLIIGFNVYPWDKDDPKSVAAVRHQFDHCMLMGMAAFEAQTVQGWYGPRTEEVSTREFNPEATQVRMTAAYAGG